VAKSEKDAAGQGPETDGSTSKRRIKPGLYVTATPIGNLGDISARAAETLASVDLIACEDKRVTSKLLAHLGVTTRLISYHDHNGSEIRPKILDGLAAGQAIALVSDAGTPLIADPGYKLVAEARDAGLPVYAVPGPSALAAALSVAGLPTDKVMFAGFAPTKSGQRDSFYRDLASIPASLVVYETGRRLADSLTAAESALGVRRAAVTRELTKLYEEIKSGPLSDLAAHYRDAGAPKGEIVLVFGPPADKAGSDSGALVDLDSFLHAAKDVLRAGDAAKLAAKLYGGQRNAYYSRLTDTENADHKEDGAA